jgi:hypothetical protein
VITGWRARAAGLSCGGRLDIETHDGEIVPRSHFTVESCFAAQAPKSCRIRTGRRPSPSRYRRQHPPAIAGARRRARPLPPRLWRRRPRRCCSARRARGAGRLPPRAPLWFGRSGSASRRGRRVRRVALGRRGRWRAEHFRAGRALNYISRRRGPASSRGRDAPTSGSGLPPAPRSPTAANAANTCRSISGQPMSWNGSRYPRNKRCAP